MVGKSFWFFKCHRGKVFNFCQNNIDPRLWPKLECYRNRKSDLHIALKHFRMMGLGSCLTFTSSLMLMQDEANATGLTFIYGGSVPLGAIWATLCNQFKNDNLFMSAILAILQLAGISALLCSTSSSPSSSRGRHSGTKTPILLGK